MRFVLIFLCLLLGGCVSTDVSSSPDLAPLIGQRLTIQRPSYIVRMKMMKDLFWGGELEIFLLREVPPDFQDRVAKGEEAHSIVVPVGTEVRLERIQRYNLIDHGVEVRALGKIRNPRTGQLEPFAFSLTDDGGSTVVRAPWEDSTVPLRREADMKGMRDFKVGPAKAAKKD